MNNYETLKNVPGTFKMVNKINENIVNNCNIKFNYFDKGELGDVKWGSEKPIDEKNNNILKSGIPIHSIWNNSTKRKTIVNKVL